MEDTLSRCPVHEAGCVRGSRWHWNGPGGSGPDGPRGSPPPSAPSISLGIGKRYTSPVRGVTVPSYVAEQWLVISAGCPAGWAAEDRAVNAHWGLTRACHHPGSEMSRPEGPDTHRVSPVSK